MTSGSRLRGKRGLDALRREARTLIAIDEQDYLKTADMYRLERLHRRNIQELLALKEGSLAIVAARLKQDKSTISKWRKRFGIR
jgi:hypothetical protein